MADRKPALMLMGLLFAVGLLTLQVSNPTSVSGQAPPPPPPPPATPSAPCPPSPLPTSPPAAPPNVTYQASWNLVGGPSGTVITGSTGSLYTLAPGGNSYESLPSATNLQAGAGYWAYFSQQASVTLPQVPIQNITVTLPAGQWTLVGNPGDTVAAVRGADCVLTFGGSSYSQNSNLPPGQGAFAYSASGGTAKVINVPATITRPPSPSPSPSSNTPSSSSSPTQSSAATPSQAQVLLTGFSTQDASGNPKTTFTAGSGDQVQLVVQVNNLTSASAPIHIDLALTKSPPCSSSCYSQLGANSVDVTVLPGVTPIASFVNWQGPASIPADVPSGIYTWTATLTANGQSSQMSTAFTITGAPAPSPSQPTSDAASQMIAAIAAGVKGMTVASSLQGIPPLATNVTQGIGAAASLAGYFLNLGQLQPLANQVAYLYYQIVVNNDLGSCQPYAQAEIAFADKVIDTANAGTLGLLPFESLFYQYVAKPIDQVTYDDAANWIASHYFKTGDQVVSGICPNN